MRPKLGIRLLNFFILVNIIIVFSNAHGQSSGPKVICEEGALEGKILKSFEGRDIFAFLGIPYAKPPVGNLRFKPPVSSDAWKGTFNATNIHSICPQRDIYSRSTIFTGDEDCLYLNVYSPKLPSDADSSLFPVMVFFHGGGWLAGSGNTIYYGPNVLLDRDIVLVVTNYRLGALGFFSTGDEIVAGNNGLKDQNLALKWVQRNIKYFGGNHKSVTIFGESAGGASVHYHVVSPLSRGLFHKAIAMSGTSLCIWAAAPKNEGKENSRKLAETLGCPTKSSREMVECLRKVDAIDIVKKDVIFMKWDFDPMIPFKPTIEPGSKHSFLSKHPIDIIKSGESAPVPLMLGVTSEEGAIRAAAILYIQKLLGELNNDFDRLLPISLMYDKTAKNISKITSELKKFYFKNEKMDWSKEQQLLNVYTDGWFLSCADETVRLHRNHTNQPVYYYLFAHKGVTSYSKYFGGGDEDYGVAHGDDLQYLFPVVETFYPDIKRSDDDKYVIKLMISLYSNFAYTGNPTPEASDIIPEKWLPVKSDKMEYYQMDAKSPKMQEGLFLDRVTFWKSLNANPRNELSKEKTNLNRCFFYRGSRFCFPRF